MKRLSQATDDAAVVSKAERWRRNSWCRNWNGFIDKPLWRTVARAAGVHLNTVQAFVFRLDDLANQSEPRGYVGDFRPAEFADALDIPVETAAALYRVLEHDDIGWIVQDHVASFWDRNRDKEEDRAKVANRQRRKRSRAAVRKQLSMRQKLGAIGAEERDAVEAMLDVLLDEQLYALEHKLKIGVALEAALSTCHGESRRDSVTVTPRADHKVSARGVDNSGRADRGEAAEPPKGAGGETADQAASAELWLATEGRRIVVERMPCNPTLAETRIERWRRDLRDDAALVDILIGADKADYVGARFHNLVVDHLKRQAAQALHGRPLPLGPAQVTGRKAADG